MCFKSNTFIKARHISCSNVQAGINEGDFFFFEANVRGRFYAVHPSAQLAAKYHKQPDRIFKGAEKVWWSSDGRKTWRCLRVKMKRFAYINIHMSHKPKLAGETGWNISQHTIGDTVELCVGSDTAQSREERRLEEEIWFFFCVCVRAAVFWGSSWLTPVPIVIRRGQYKAACSETILYSVDPSLFSPPPHLQPVSNKYVPQNRNRFYLHSIYYLS